MRIIEDLSENVVERLSLYRQHLLKYRYASSSHINSAVLSRLTGATQESVRRDMMLIGCQAQNIRMGYPVEEVIDRINAVLDPFDICRMALVGNNDALTEIMLHEYENALIRLVAVFDFELPSEHKKKDDVKCFRLDLIHETIKSLHIKLAILNVPGDYTLQTAQILHQAGIKGIINLSSVNISIPGIYVENLNMITAIEKATFFMKWRQYI